jgi:type IV secretion system protein VirB10
MHGGQSTAHQLSPYEQALEQQNIDAWKRAQKAREGGFGFTGGGSGTGTQGTQSNMYGAPADRESPAAAVGAALAGLAKPAATDRDADNRQDDKAAFVGKERQNRWALERVVQWPSSPYTMFAGTVLPGVLITGINSDLPGQIKGQISQNVYDTVTGKYLLLPQGTEVLGEYDSRITYGQSRVLVVWTRLIRPDGSNIDLETMPGVDLSGYAGLPGKVDRHLLRLATAVVLGSLIEAGAQSGTNYTFPSYTDRARQGAGQGVNEATQQIVRKELSVQPTITVAPGTRFDVFSTKDIVLPPYKG